MSIYMKRIHFIIAKHERNLILYTNFLYICRQKCYFSGFWGDCSVGAYNPPSPVGVKGSVSAAESSLHVLGIFLHITAKKAKQSHPQPLSGTVSAREMCCGWSWVVLRVRSTVLRSAGSTWRSSVPYRRPWPDPPVRCSGRWRSEWRASG